MLRSFFALLVVLVISTPAHAEPDDAYYVFIGAFTFISLIAGLVIFFFIKRNQARKVQERVESAFLESKLTPESFFGASACATEEPLTHTDDVDPIAEADVYLAYGRDIQAEEILKEGLATEKDTARTVKYLLRLLEIHDKRRSRNEVKECFSRIKELTQGAGLDYFAALDIAKKLIPQIEEIDSESVTNPAPPAHSAPSPEAISLNQSAPDDIVKAVLKNLETLTDGWKPGEKTIAVQTLNSKGNPVTSTITISVK